jgi:ribosomal protein S6--L-glutamate ligase
MKSWILSSDSEIASTKRLLAALERHGLETEVLNPLELSFEFGRQGPRLFQRGIPVRSWPELVWPRLGWSTLEHGLRVSQFLESHQIPVINSSQSLRETSDKLLCLQILQQAEIPLPQTRFAHSSRPTEEHLFPQAESQVLKSLCGSQGFGVTWQTSRPQSRAALDSFRNLQSPILVQELVQESFGSDIRVLVAGGKALAAIRREGAKGDLRSNLHQGGQAAPIELTDLEKTLALRACETLGLFYAGVDFLRSSQGPLMIEVNPCPGFEGISKVTNQDWAEAVVASSLR